MCACALSVLSLALQQRCEHTYVGFYLRVTCCVVASSGWVRLPVFDFNMRLQHGTVIVKLWPDEPPACATSVVNHGDIDAVRLTLQFAHSTRRVRWHRNETSQTPHVEFTKLSHTVRDMLDDIIARNDAGIALSHADLRSVWLWRRALTSRPDSLALVSRAVASDVASLSDTIYEMHALLKIWPPLGQPLLAIELLGATFVDSVTREWAVAQLERVESNDVLLSVLLALVQALKYELFLNNALTRFLLRRAMRSTRVGQRLYWLLNAEIARDVTHATQFGLILEAYLRADDRALASIMRQRELVNTLIDVVTAASRDINTLDIELRTVARKLAAGAIECPLDYRFKLSSLRTERCKFTNAKRTVLLLVFGCDEAHDGVRMLLFKIGNDTRRDVTALDAMRWMSAVWRREALDVNLTTYECMPASNSSTLCEVLRPAVSLATVTTRRRRNNSRNAMPLLDWLTDSAAQMRVSVDSVLDRFGRSCAAFCVASYVLGIAERHSELTGVRGNGELFHIEFAQLFARTHPCNIASSTPRTAVPFTLSRDVKRTIANRACSLGENEPAAAWSAFVALGTRAMGAVRRNAHLLRALLTAVLPIDGMSTTSDIEFVASAMRARDDSWLSAVDPPASRRLSINEKLHSMLGLPSSSAATSFNLPPFQYENDHVKSSRSATAAPASASHKVYTVQNALDLVRSHAELRDSHVPIDVTVNDSNERPPGIVALLTTMASQLNINIDRLSLVELKHW
jgi:hypothetical protein